MIIFRFIQLLLTFKVLTADNKNQTEKNATDDKPKFLSKPKYIDKPHLLLMFNSSSDLKRHGRFSNIRDEEKDNLKYTGVWKVEVTNSTPYVNDYQLVMKTNSSYAAVSFGMNRPFKFDSKCLIVQYDFRYPNEHDCGGAYIKFFPEHNFDMKALSNETLYSIMFGPDKCGMDYEIKFIFNYPDIKTKKQVERRQLKDAKKFPRFLGDNVTHVITLMVCENNTYQIFKDLRLIEEGLLIDFEPSIGGERMIVDVNDSKPANWDMRQEILDPYATKPDYWDENAPEFISDLNAVKPKNWLENEPLMVESKDSKPHDWDEEENGPWKPAIIKNFKCKVNGCGLWTPPKIRNPKYRGKWSPALIYNPNYHGEWQPRKIPNPEYVNDTKIYKNMMPFNAMGIEIWSQKGGIQFDNILVTDNFTLSRNFAMDSWWPKFLVDTIEQPHYRSIFNETKRVRKRNFSAYLHWVWAALPLILGLPVLGYVSWLIAVKSNRDPYLAKERCIMRAYEKLKKGDEALISNLPTFDARPTLEDEIPSPFGERPNLDDIEISDEAINQFFGQDDKVAAVLRKRMRDRALANKVQSPGGDAN